MAGGTAVYASPTLAVRSYDAVAASDSHRSYHQIVLGIDGGMEVAVDQLATVVDASMGMVIPAGARHDYLGLGLNRQLIVDVPVDALTLPRHLFDEASLIRIDPRFQQWVLAVARGADSADPFVHWQATAHVCDALLLRGMPGFDPRAARFTLPRIDAFLRTHLAEPLSISDLAAHCGCGVRTFHDRFVVEFGITPYRYLMRLRVEQAARLMHEPRRSLADIAANMGFTDQSAFTHAFVARFGVTPGRWRAGARDVASA